MGSYLTEHLLFSLSFLSSFFPPPLNTSSMVKELATKDEFHNAIKSGNVVAIDFTTTWCGPCRMIGPKFVEMAGEYSSITCYKLDVDENADAAAEAGIKAMPTFKFYKNGSEVKEIVGADVSKLKAAFEE